MCISKVDCQWHIHTAARIHTQIVDDYIALIVRANEPYATLYIFHNFMSFDYFYAGQKAKPIYLGPYRPTVSPLVATLTITTT